MTPRIVTENIVSPFYDSITKGEIEQLNAPNYTAIIADDVPFGQPDLIRIGRTD